MPARKTPTRFPEPNVFWVDDPDELASTVEQPGQANKGDFTAHDVVERFNISHADSITVGSSSQTSLLTLFPGNHCVHETMRLVERLGGVGLWRWDLSSGDMEWSHGLCRMLDIDPGIAKPSFRQLVSMIYPPDRPWGVEIASLASKGLPIERNFRLMLANGRLRFLEMRGEVLFDREGRPTRAVGILFDATSRQQELQAIRAVADRYDVLRAAIPEFVLVTEPDGAVIDVHAWRNATGQSVADTERVLWLDGLHPDDRITLSARWNLALERQECCEVEGRILTNSGTYRWVSVRANPIPTSEKLIREWVIVFVDCDEPSALQREPDGRERITGAQMRAARAILNWSVRDLGAKSGISTSTIRRFEEFDGTLDQLRDKNGVVRSVLEGAGAEFFFPRLGKPGVRPR